MIKVELTGETVMEIVEKMLMMLNGINVVQRGDNNGSTTAGDRGAEISQEGNVSVQNPGPDDGREGASLPARYVNVQSNVCQRHGIAAENAGVRR